MSATVFLLALIGGMAMTLGAIFVQPENRSPIKRVLISWLLSVGVVLSILASSMN